MNIARVSECEKRIRSYYDQLPSAERKVADIVLSNMSAVLDYCIAELAYASKVSEPTVVRFCRHIGYRGLKDLKVSIAKTLTPADAEPLQYTNIVPGDTIDVIKQKVTHSILQAFQDTMDILNNDDLQKAVDILRQSHYIEIFGVGGSAMVARLAQHNFRKLGMRITLCTDPESTYFMTEQYSKGDVIFAISVSGETESVVNAVKFAKSHGAMVISITGVDNSTLKALSDVNLPAMSRSYIILPEDHSYVRLAQTGIVDLLYAAIYAEK